MASPTQSVTHRTGTAPVITLLVIAVLINYVDRGNLALAAPLLAKDWGLSASKLGILLSAFFWTYVLLQIPVGWLVDRFQASSILAFGFLAWSAATALTGLARGFTTLLAMRLLLGVGEAVVFPASSKIFSESLEEKDRGLANGLLVAAIRWGTAVGAFGGGLLMAHFGWRRTFLAIGLVALLWLPAWQRWKPRRVLPEQLPPESLPPAQPQPTFLSIARLRPFWGASLGHLSENYLLYLLMSWLPYYLVHERHLSTTAMAWTAGLLYTMDSIAAIVAGRIADLCIRRRVRPTSARKWPMIAGLLLAAVSLVACASAGPKTWFLSLAGAAVGCGLSCSGVYAVPQTLAGPRLAGRWVGMQNCVANFAGIVAPVLTGFLVQRTGHFSSALTLAAGIAALGALAWLIGVRPSDEPRPLPDLVLAENRV
ncbi:MAG TPA: MFS transporter [Acidobacteriaceae bacterium]|jgi:MFS family permease|nr:MFS transporter [Acidobacteriaceae bacterium]